VSEPVGYEHAEALAKVRSPEPHDWLRNAFLSMVLWTERNRETDELRPGVRETPARAARAWAELTRGYNEKLDLKLFEAEGDQMIVEAGVPFYSLCEHHLLPFFGNVDFAYIPHEHIIGLSKFARLTDVFSRRLQVQERLTYQLAEALEHALKPQGVMVIVRGQHLCKEMRGVQKQGSRTVTSVVMGAFENSETRAEAMRLMS
jgi:GTP cyclohydrolase IA